MTNRVFPINTKTSCQLKWAWSTLYLNTGITRSCHRTSESTLTPENFFNFHNTPLKIADRKSMLRGEWPETSCSYCKDIEEVGGVSDRIRMANISDISPIELDTDATATVIDPTLVEVFFNNTCNLGCLYCTAEVSSTIEAENNKFGLFEKYGVNIEPYHGQFKTLIPYFWKWFETEFQKIKRFHVLGGEPFYQREFDKLLDMIEQYPNPDCELNVVTNLMVSPARLQEFVNRFKKLLVERKLKRIDITCSIDCWGPEQEYVRYGLDLMSWDNNFNFLLAQKWIYLNINQTISALTIKTMPELLIKLANWRKHRKIGHWFSGVTPGPSYLKANIFGNEFTEDIEKILNLMPTDTAENIKAQEYMKRIFLDITSLEQNIDEIIKLIVYLDEKDRRRGTQWSTLFPWIEKYRHYVV